MSQFTQSPSEPVLKPRDAGQLLDRSFKLFGRSWKPLLAVGAVTAAPGLLWGLLSLSMLPATDDPSAMMNHWFFRMITAAETGDYSGLIAIATVWGILGFALFLLTPLFQGALIDVATRAVLQMEPVPLGESFRVAARRYWAILGTYLLKGLIWILAIPLMILGGLLIFAVITVPLGSAALLVVTVFANHAIIIEGKEGGMPALRRAWELGKSRFWPLMGLGLLFNLLVMLLQFMVAAPFSFGGAIISAFTEAPWVLSINTIVQSLATAVTAPFLAVALTLVYFDTRVRREGYDLEVMAQQQIQEQAPSPEPLP